MLPLRHRYFDLKELVAEEDDRIGAVVSALRGSSEWKDLDEIVRKALSDGHDFDKFRLETERCMAEILSNCNAPEILMALQGVSERLMYTVVIAAVDRVGLENFPADSLAALPILYGKRYQPSHMPILLHPKCVSRFGEVATALAERLEHVSRENLIAPVLDLCRMVGLDTVPLLKEVLSRSGRSFLECNVDQFYNLVLACSKSTFRLKPSYYGDILDSLFSFFVMRLFEFRPGRAAATLQHLVEARGALKCVKDDLDMVDSFFSGTTSVLSVDDLHIIAMAFNRLRYVGKKTSVAFSKTLLQYANKLPLRYVSSFFFQLSFQPVVGEGLFHALVEAFPHIVTKSTDCNVREWAHFARALSRRNVRRSKLAQQLGHMIVEQLQATPSQFSGPNAAALLYSLNALSVCPPALTQVFFDCVVSEFVLLPWLAMSQLLHGLVFAIRRFPEFERLADITAQLLPGHSPVVPLTIVVAGSLIFACASLQIQNRKIINKVTQLVMSKPAYWMRKFGMYYSVIVLSLCSLRISRNTFLALVAHAELVSLVWSITPAKRCEWLMWLCYYDAWHIARPQLNELASFSPKAVYSVEKKSVLVWLNVLLLRQAETRSFQLPSDTVDQLARAVSEDFILMGLRLVFLQALELLLDNSGIPVHHTSPFFTPEGLRIDMAILLKTTLKGRLLPEFGRRVAILMLGRDSYERTTKELLGHSSIHCQALAVAGWQVLLMPLFELESTPDRTGYFQDKLRTVGLVV